MPAAKAVVPIDLKKSMLNALKVIGYGAAAGVPTGIAAGALRREVLNPAEITALPESEETFEIIDDDQDGTDDRLESILKMSALQGPTLMHLIGAAGGIGAGVAGHDWVADKLRERELASNIKKQNKELQLLLLEEQSLAKQGEAKLNLLTAPVSRLAQATGTYIKELPTLQQGMFMAVPAISGILAGREAYKRTVKGDPSRARMAELKSSLKRRLGEDAGEGRRSPLLLKLVARGGLDTPLKPGASALVDPSKGRDIFSF